MALPGVHDVVRVRVHYFVFGLDDTCRPFFIRRLLTLFLIVLSKLCVLSVFLRLLFLGHLLLMSLYLVPDILLKLSLHLIVVHYIT